MTPASERLPWTRVSVAALFAAIAVPALFSEPSRPTASFETNFFAFTGWGIWLTWVAWIAQRSAEATKGRRPISPGTCDLFAALGLLAAAAIASSVLAGWPARLLWPQLAVLAAAAVALAGGFCVGRLSTSDRSLTKGQSAQDLAVLFLWALVLTGAINAVLAVAQHAGAAEWWPGLMPPGKDGRPGGHLRHPSHLGTWLIWSVCALVALRALERCRPAAFWGLGAALMAGIVVSGSRTAALCCLLLAIWAIADKRIDRRARVALLFTPIIVLLGWWMLLWWSQTGSHAFGGATVIQKADLSSSRGRLWQQAWVLIKNDPMTGVGYGQFNFAWSLTPMEGLPRVGGHTFTHAHNLFVHWAVELGVPLTLLLAGLLATSLAGAARASFRGSPPASAVGRSAFVMVLVVLLHSQLEFPLWYLHFLLPAAFLWGLALAGAPDKLPADPVAAFTAPLHQQRDWRFAALGALACAMVLGGLFALQQYQAISQVYQPSDDAPADDVRIAKAQQSWLYGHLADRLSGTLAPRGQRELAPFREVVFEMLDPSLMAAWASAHDENCKQARAEYLGDRMREFGWAVPTRSQPRIDEQTLCPQDTASLGYRDFR